MTDSPHYTDHLINALRCLDDNSLRNLATNILNRLPSNNCGECGGCRGYSSADGWHECHACGGTGVAYGSKTETDRSLPHGITVCTDCGKTHTIDERCK